MTTKVFDVCVIGAGPAGIGFASEWAKNVGHGDVLLIEAGVDAASRSCTVRDLKGCRKVSPCQVTSGVGGSSGLSGGKLSEYPAGRGLADLMGDNARTELLKSREQLESYMTLTPSVVSPELLASEEQRFRDLDFELRHYPANKYAQSDLSEAWTGILAEAEDSGVTVRLNTRATSIESARGGVRIHLESLDGLASVILARAVVIATGRTGSELLGTLGVNASEHAIDVGVRIEFPADLWPDLDAAHGDLKLHFGNARTFCASKSGWISPYRYKDIMLLEGRTDIESKSDWSNLAISVRTKRDPVELIDTVRSSLLAQGPGNSVRQPLNDYIAGETSLQTSRKPEASFSYWRWGDVNSLFPKEVSAEIHQAVAKFSADVLPPAAAAEAYVFGPELDYYWATIPHRGVRTGVWSAGDVSGQYRGTLQAFTAGRYLVSEVKDFLSSGTDE